MAPASVILSESEGKALDNLVDAVRAVISLESHYAHGRKLTVDEARRLASALQNWEYATGTITDCPDCSGEGFFERIIGSREINFGFEPITEDVPCDHCQARGFIEVDLYSHDEDSQPVLFTPVEPEYAQELPF